MARPLTRKCSPPASELITDDVTFDRQFAELRWIFPGVLCKIVTM
jgi:hypothetical protein